MNSPRIFALILAGSLTFGACGAAERAVQEQLTEAALGGDVDVEIGGDDSFTIEGEDGGTFTFAGDDGEDEFTFSDDDGAVVMGSGQNVPNDYEVPLPQGMQVESFIDINDGDEEGTMLVGSAGGASMDTIKAHFDAYAANFSDAEYLNMGSPDSAAHMWMSESGNFMITAGGDAGDEVAVMVMTGDFDG